MRVAIFGSRKSRHEVRAFRNLSKFPSFCREMGTSLAAEGHTLIVQSDDDRTADFFVVDGVRQMDSRPVAMVEAWWRTAEKPDGSSKEEPFANDDWVAKEPAHFAFVGNAHLDMLERADVAIVIGGGRHTYLAGQTARATNTRLIPIPEFGGAGQVLWDEVRRQPGQSTTRMIDPDRLLRLRNPAEVLDAALEEIASLPKVMIVHGRSDDHKRVEEMLRDAGVPNPIPMEKYSKAGETIPTAFERIASTVDGAVVVITPDDLGCARINPDGSRIEAGEMRPRARQNVVIEYGWFWCRFGLEGVLPLVRHDPGSPIELPSDIRGMVYVEYSEPDDVVADLANFVARLHR